MDELLTIDIGWIKHGSWIIFTLVWILFNYFQPKETGYLSGAGNLITFGISTIVYLICWVIWLIIF